MTVARLLCVVGVVLMLHAIVSLAQHRTSGDVEVTDTIPLEISVECVLAFLLACYGYVSDAARFESIRKQDFFARRRYENIHFRPDFMTFNHRGSALADD
eukprot:TRINITY_DN5021_c0_g1_i1.p1 TRINITY_DN5021_c0_g1~~TRINITY_DN5021_c0_g1_i1.p1  ORF type:complete len:100 (-),score=20.21 TRINITY_DN5021_c0_g1_i1:228-527(-)